MVEGGKLPRHFIGLVEGRADRPGEAKTLSNRRKGGQDREGVRAAHDVEVVDLPGVLSQPQALGQEQEVELRPLRGRAKWTNEANSMWLPDLGSLHTVVLLTPGK